MPVAPSHVQALCSSASRPAGFLQQELSAPAGGGAAAPSSLPPLPPPLPSLGAASSDDDDYGASSGRASAGPDSSAAAAQAALSSSESEAWGAPPARLPAPAEQRDDADEDGATGGDARAERGQLLPGPSEGGEDRGLLQGPWDAASGAATRWTSSTLSSVDLADWGMGEDTAAAWRELSASALASALRGYGGNGGDGASDPHPGEEEEVAAGEEEDAEQVSAAPLTERELLRAARLLAEEGGGRPAVPSAWLAQQAVAPAPSQEEDEREAVEGAEGSAREGPGVREAVAAAVAAASAGRSDADVALDSALELLRRQVLLQRQ